MLTDTLDPEKYQRLLASLSHKAYRRAASKGFYIDFDDLMQEARETLFIAAEKFDPEKGVKFTTYLWSAVQNNLKRVEGKIISDQVKTSSLDADIGDDVGTLHDILPSNGETVEEKLLRLERENDNFCLLSEEARAVIMVLDAPSIEVHREVLRQEAFREHCKVNKMAAATRILDVQAVCNIIGYDKATTRRVKRELKGMTECDIGNPGPPMLDEPCYVCGAAFACSKCEGAIQIGNILYG